MKKAFGLVQDPKKSPRVCILHPVLIRLEKKDSKYSYLDNLNHIFCIQDVYFQNAGNSLFLPDASSPHTDTEASRSNSLGNLTYAFEIRKVNFRWTNHENCVIGPVRKKGSSG